jgi:hypothetical protein
VRVVADHAIPVKTANGEGLVPVYVFFNGKPADLAQPQAGVVRALLVIHGLHREAEQNSRVGLRAIDNAGAAGQGTLLIAPQFLEEADAEAHHLPGNVLRWVSEQWMSGGNAANTAVSSFDAIDLILATLANHRIFPNLKTVVIAGHSAGGQCVQRYAAVGRGVDGLEKAGIHVRFVVANPSSYLYFSPERPNLKAHDQFTFAVPTQTCFGKYNHWKYGVLDAPPYVGAVVASEIEQRYIRRDVVYLLGTKDNDPNHPELDASCAAEDEGPHRFFRGKAYFRYLLTRHPELAGESAAQRLWAVPGVEHNNDRMFNSQCGLAALFDVGVCSTPIVDPAP